MDISWGLLWIYLMFDKFSRLFIFFKGGFFFFFLLIVESQEPG